MACTSRAVPLLFVTRGLRLASYGAIAPIFFLYCSALGLSEVATGVLLTGILIGDLAITLALSAVADRRIGRRTTLVVGAALKAGAGVAFGFATSFAVLLVAGIIGVISTSGGEIGPFLAVEQACLTDAVTKASVRAEPARRGSGGAGAELHDRLLPPEDAVVGGTAVAPDTDAADKAASKAAASTGSEVAVLFGCVI